jgi:hypothetical protein
MSQDETLGTGETAAGPEPELHCDFCGRPARSVRRVALDDGYDRLARPHRVLYACETCSEAKERERASRPG